MNKLGLNMGSVKHQNRSLILNHINSHGPVSRKDIARETGLTAAAVTQIVARLISEGILSEIGSVSGPAGSAGRRKILVDIKADAMYAYAVNIEPDVTNIALCDLKGRPAKDRTGSDLVKTIPTDSAAPPEQFLGRIADECGILLKYAPTDCEKKLKAVSVGITGIVDIKGGKSIHAYGVWKEPVNVRHILGSRLGLPVLIENNVDAFAAAALLFGIGKTHDNFFVIKWGPGVGSAIILNGSLYKVPNGRSAEFGHLIMEKNGKLCNCGRRGCLETLVSYSALNELVRFDSDNFGECYANAPEDVKQKIDYRIDLFARSIINSATIIGPRRIVLFGKMFRDKTLRDMLIEACRSYDSAYGPKRIAHTGLADSEGYIGPAAVFAQNCFDSF